MRRCFKVFFKKSKISGGEKEKKGLILELPFPMTSIKRKLRLARPQHYLRRQELPCYTKHVYASHIPPIPYVATLWLLPPYCNYCNTKFLLQLECHTSAIRYSCHTARHATRRSRRRRQHFNNTCRAQIFGDSFCSSSPGASPARPEDGICASLAPRDKGWVIKRDSRELPFFPLSSNNHCSFHLTVDGPRSVSPTLSHFLIDRAESLQSNIL